MINVLWIDDQPQEALIDRAFTKYNLNIVNTLNVEDGISELTCSETIYDAIILDANCVRNSEGNQSPDVSALAYAFRRIREEGITLPWAVYSAGGFAGENTIDVLIDGNQEQGKEVVWYRKPAQANELLAKVNELAQNSTEFKVKAKYKEAFDKYPNQRDLLKILMYLENDINDNPSVFTDIRKELEWIMPYCAECGVLQGTKFDGTNLADCSRALGNKILTDIIPLHVQRSFYAVVSVSNTGSHRTYIDEAVKHGDAPYLVRSTIFELLNIIHWMNTLPQGEAERSELKAQISELLKPKELTAEDYEGQKYVVEQDDSNNYHCATCRISFKKAAPYLGKCVLLYNVKSNEAKSKDNYPFFADFKPIEDKD